MSTPNEPSHFPPETLESDLLAHLSSTTVLEDLHTTLLCSLQRMGWTEKIRKLTAELLRAGRCERFDDVVDAVVATAEGRKHAALAGSSSSANANTGTGGNGNGSAAGEGGETAAYFENVDVRIPRVVVEQGVKALKEVIGEVVVLEGEEDAGKKNEGDGPAKEDGVGEKKPDSNSNPIKREDAG